MQKRDRETPRPLLFLIHRLYTVKAQNDRKTSTSKHKSLKSSIFLPTPAIPAFPLCRLAFASFLSVTFRNLLKPRSDTESTQRFGSFRPSATQWKNLWKTQPSLAAMYAPSSSAAVALCCWRRWVYTPSSTSGVSPRISAACLGSSPAS